MFNAKFVIVFPGGNEIIFCTLGPPSKPVLCVAEFASVLVLEPNPVPLAVTCVPTGPELGDMFNVVANAELVVEKIIVDKKMANSILFFILSLSRFEFSFTP